MGQLHYSPEIVASIESAFSADSTGSLSVVLGNSEPSRETVDPPNGGAVNATDLSVDQDVRVRDYRTLVPAYGGVATPIYRAGWGDSSHLMPISGDQALAEAAEAMEIRLADDGRFHSGMHILDVGRGIGGPKRTIARHTGARLTSLNSTAIQLVVAEKLTAQACLFDRVEFIEGDAMAVQFADNTFDAAYLFESLCYAYAPRKAAVCAETARVVKPGGLFLGYDWTCTDDITAQDYERYIEPLCRSRAVTGLLSPRQLETCLREPGFEVEPVQAVALLGRFGPLPRSLRGQGALVGGASGPDRRRRPRAGDDRDPGPGGQVRPFPCGALAGPRREVIAVRREMSRSSGSGAPTGERMPS